MLFVLLAVQARGGPLVQAEEEQHTVRYVCMTQQSAEEWRQGNVRALYPLHAAHKGLSLSLHSNNALGHSHRAHFSAFTAVR